MSTVVIPYCPRNWANKLHRSFKRWAAIILHRRAGKTTAILNHHQRAALDDIWETTRLRYLMPAISDLELTQLLKRRTYWHTMPTFHQAKLTGAWDTLKEISRGVPGVKHNESELLCTYPNGNKIQLIGADNPDSLRGPALSGLSLDEYSQIPVNAFGEVLSKSLADHLGYCIFSGTIKGKDHLYKTYEAAKTSLDWFSLWQDVDESLATEEGATITALKTAMEDDRKLVMQGLMTQAEFDQEWYLSYEAAIKGAFYGDILKKIRQAGQICKVPYDPALPVDTDWDLGVDAMAIWFSQSTRSGQERVIDYYEDYGGGLDLAVKAIKGQLSETDPKVALANMRRRQYTYGQHWGPHDVNARQYAASAKTTKQIAFEMGVTFQDTPKIPVSEGITATMLMLPKCWFDAENCEQGLMSLQHYRRTLQKALGADASGRPQYSETPVHDWASHGSDAFRGKSVRHRTPGDKVAALPPWGKVSSPYS